MEICVLYSQGEEGRQRELGVVKIAAKYLSGFVNGLIKIAAMILLRKNISPY